MWNICQICQSNEDATQAVRVGVNDHFACLNNGMQEIKVLERAEVNVSYKFISPTTYEFYSIIAKITWEK